MIRQFLKTAVNQATGIWIAVFIAGICVTAGPADLRAENVFITIGGGDVSGVYFPAGLAIAGTLNDKRDEYGIRATVEATKGSTFNLNAILAGFLEFGLSQSDKQYQAVHGLAEWAEKGPQTQLRSVFSLHHELVTLVAALDAGINSIGDLKAKRVSIGNPRSSQHRTVTDALVAVGFDPTRDLIVRNVMASEAPASLQDNRIDAYFFTVGHPSDTVRRALANQRKTRIIPISGPAIDQLVADHVPYAHSVIPVSQLYPEAADPAPVATFGVIATLCTSSRVPADVVYALTKEVFENLEVFRRQHPAFSNLTREGMLEGLTAPLHSGAHRYYAEIGLIQ
ncbi:MAG TPA: TAXI family TRAP transporter solute-binding subunit [Desulfobacterales bacterium]